MKLAVRSRVIAYNPMAEVERPRVEESEDVFLTAAQVEALADAMEKVGPGYRALVWVGCYAGPRIGELAALRWTDVDLDARTLSISRKVVEVSGHGMVEGGTKTNAGRRTVTLPRRVVAELERHRARFPRDPLVFTGPDGG
ncbi:MAG: site-specific integrase [Actinomycetota bacterium]|nr:site-specific integrase [Actinomycetota bacterium]